MDDHYMPGQIVLLADGTRAKVIGLMAAVDHSFEVDKYRIEQAGARRFIEATEITGPAEEDELWVCIAYGGMPDAHVACFFTEVGRVCHSLLECSNSVANERKRVWRIMQEKAAAGDPIMIAMLETIKGPEDMLGGFGA